MARKNRPGVPLRCQEGDIGCIKKAIHGKGSVYAGIRTTRSFKYSHWNGTYEDGVYVKDDGEAYEPGSHGITVHGWGTTASGVHYWEARNSWGTDWGDEGFFRIKFGELGVEKSVWYTDSEDTHNEASNFSQYSRCLKVMETLDGGKKGCSIMNTCEDSVRKVEIHYWGGKHGCGRREWSFILFPGDKFKKELEEAYFCRIADDKKVEEHDGEPHYEVVLEETGCILNPLKTPKEGKREICCGAECYHASTRGLVPLEFCNCENVGEKTVGTPAQLQALA